MNHLLIISFLTFFFGSVDIPDKERPRREFTTNTTLQCATFSNDGRLIVATDIQGNLNIFHTRLGIKLKSISLENTVVALAASNYSPNEVACADVAGLVSFWDVENGTMSRSFKAGKSIKKVQYTKDGQQLLVHFDGYALFYNVWTGKEVRKMDYKNASSMAYDQSAKLLVTTQPDNSIIMWDYSNEEEKITALGRHNGLITHMEMDEKGQYLLTSSFDRIVKVWDLIAGKQVNELKLESAVNYVTFGLNEKTVVTASNDGKTTVWDISENPKALKFFYGNVRKANYVQCHPKEQIILTGYKDTNVLQTWIVN